MRLMSLSFCVALLIVAAARADDWPQWRGPDRNGISKEKGLLAKWPEAGPKLLWTLKQGGVGYSAPVVVGDTLYTLGAWDKKEYIYAVDVKTGQQKWNTELGEMFDWKGNTWNAGPNSSAAVSGDLVYALSGKGDLVCVDKNGKEQWRKNMAKDFGGEVNNIGGSPEKIGWGWAWSPLVDGDNLICVPGGKKGLLLALNKKTGAAIWQSATVTEGAPYSSPIAAQVGGVKMYVQMTNNGIYGFDPQSGKDIWSYAKQYEDVVIPTPVQYKDNFFVTAGFNAGSDIITLAVNGKAVKAQGANQAAQALLDKLDNREGGVVVVDGFVFGHFEQPGLSCIDMSNANTVWSNKTTKRGSIVYAEGRLYYYNSETSEVMLVDASTKKPNKFSELVTGQFTLPQKSKLNKSGGRNWTHPVIADGKLYIRDQDLLFCFEIK